MSHTKTPWTAEWSQWPSNGGKVDSLDIYGKDGSCIATLKNANKDANAALIVQAVNAHQAMKEALEAISARMRGEYDHPSLVARGPLHNEIHTMKAQMQEWADQALAKANGKEPHD